jgi:Icc-related predicted phosphoesterase
MCGAMRIAYLVDVHGQFDAVDDAMGEIGAADLLIIGGDITTGGTPDQAATAIQRWRRLAPRLLALAGNMDSAEIDARLSDLGLALDARGYRLGAVGVFGVSAAPHSPLRTPYELSEDELDRRISDGFSAVRECSVKVFCPHAPPRGTSCDRLPNGEHVGSTAVRSFVDREQPDVVLCGHIHEARGVDRIGATQIVNPGPAGAGHYAIVDIDETVTVRLDP